MRLSALGLWAALALWGAAPGLDGDAELPRVPQAPFVRGVALGLFATDPQWDYAAMLDEIRARGATDVLVVVNAFQADRFSSDIALVPGHSPGMATIGRTLRQVRERGMRAALMPVVRLRRRGAGDWRGRITPADGLDAWFAAYRALWLPLAELAEREHATRFVIGSELNSLQGEGRRWRALARQVRARYTGSLVYSANWDRIDDVVFWDAVDEVGVTGYFPLATREGSQQSAALARAWSAPRARLSALSARLGRPVLITELGYPSQPGAATHPWDDTRSRVVDLALQKQLYEGFCDAFEGARHLSGFYVWNWFGFGGPRDAGYSPRGKPAASAIGACFARAWHQPAAATGSTLPVRTFPTVAQGDSP